MVKSESPSSTMMQPDVVVMARSTNPNRTLRGIHLLQRQTATRRVPSSCQRSTCSSSQTDAEHSRDRPCGADAGAVPLEEALPRLAQGVDLLGARQVADGHA